MLRRIFKNPDGGVGPSLSGVILPGCASLIVPILAVTALELPAAAIDRIAAPLLGRSSQIASLFRPPFAQSAIGDTLPPYVTADELVAAGAVRPSAFSGDAVGARRAEYHPLGEAPEVGATPWVDDWSDTPMDSPRPGFPEGDGDPGGGAADIPASGDQGGNDGSGTTTPPGPGAYDDGAAADVPVGDTSSPGGTGSDHADGSGGDAGTGSGTDEPSSDQSTRPAESSGGGGSGNGGGGNGGTGQPTVADQSSEAGGANDPGTAGSEGTVGGDASGGVGSGDDSSGTDSDAPGDPGDPPTTTTTALRATRATLPATTRTTTTMTVEHPATPGTRRATTTTTTALRETRATLLATTRTRTTRTAARATRRTRRVTTRTTRLRATRGTLPATTTAASPREHDATGAEGGRGQPRAAPPSPRVPCRALLGTDARDRRRHAPRLHPSLRAESGRADGDTAGERRGPGRGRRAASVRREGRDLPRAARRAGPTLRRTGTRRRDAGVGHSNRRRASGLRDRRRLRRDGPVARAPR